MKQPLLGRAVRSASVFFITFRKQWYVKFVTIKLFVASSLRRCSGLVYKVGGCVDGGFSGVFRFSYVSRNEGRSREENREKRKREWKFLSFSSHDSSRGLRCLPSFRATNSPENRLLCRLSYLPNKNKTTKQTREKRNFTSPERLKIYYLKVERDNIDGNRRGPRKVLKCSSQKSLREEEPWYPENLPKKQNYYYGKANKTNCSVIKFELTGGIPCSIHFSMNWTRATRSVTQDASGLSDG